MFLTVSIDSLLPGQRQKFAHRLSS
jgi:hypothetical protein